MQSKKNCVVVTGDDNLLHHGLFDLIASECRERQLTVLSFENYQQLRNLGLPRGSGCFQLAILCLECQDFFPHWFSTFLTLLRKANGNVLIFTDSHLLLNNRKRNLLNRVCEIDHIIDISMPVSYISFVLRQYLNRKRTLRGSCKISVRELDVIDGFLNGVDALCHAAKLGIKTRTLYQHRKNCANKLGFRNLKDLLRL